MSDPTFPPPPCRTSALLLATLLAGCAVGPNYKAPQAPPQLPAQYAEDGPAISPAAAADRWWAMLGDPALDHLVETALADSPDLLAAESRVQQARGLAEVAGASFYPQSSLQGEVLRNQLSRNGENLSLIPIRPKTTIFSDYRVGVDASWEIDLAGKTRRDVEAAVARLASADESRNDARSVVAAAVASAYLDYRGAAERLVLAERNVASLQETQRLVALQVKAGLESQTTYQRAQADAQAAAAALAPLQAQQRVAVYQLASLTAQPVAKIEAALQGAGGVPEVPGVTPVGLPADVLRRRPDIRRAERDLAAASAEVGSAIAEQYPRIALVGDLGWDSVHSGSLTSAASRYWDLAPQLSIPLWARARLKGNIHAAEAAQAAALSSYRSIVLQGIADAESSLVRYASERQRAARLAVSAQSLQVALQNEQQRATAGDVATLDVLAADRAAIAAADAQVASRTQLAHDYVNLCKALGGGWQWPGATPTAQQGPVAR